MAWRWMGRGGWRRRGWVWKSWQESCCYHCAARAVRGRRCTLHPAPCTLHPVPCTLHPAPCRPLSLCDSLPLPSPLSLLYHSLCRPLLKLKGGGAPTTQTPPPTPSNPNPTPCTPHPAPCTLHSTSHTSHPTSYTLHPTP